jgi:hypothetical protein
MSNAIGYISNYTLDSNTGKINSGTLNTTDPTSLKPITVNLDASSNMYAIINVNKIISPNINDQYLPMTNDSKYIILPEANLDGGSIYLLYYPLMYACVNYNITIPSIINIFFFEANITDNDFTPDNTYNQITSEAFRNPYKKYLIGLNPPPKLLQKINTPKIWNDIGYFYKAQYEVMMDKDGIRSNLSNFCLPFVHKINDPNSQLAKIDCSYLPKASPVISSNNNTLGINADNTSMGIGVSICICICCCCLVIGGVFLMMSMKSKSKLKKK